MTIGVVGRRILLIGVDRYLLRACAANGVDAIVVCGHNVSDSGYTRVPDGVIALFVDDPGNPEHVLGALLRVGIDQRRFDAVVTNDERWVVQTSVLAAYLGVKGIDPTTALHFRDKHLQKRVVRAAGLPAARSVVIPDICDVDGFTEADCFEGVVKPIAGAGAANTWKVRDLADLQRVSRACRQRGPRQRTFVYEEFIDGQEAAVDGFVVGRELRFMAIAQYSEPCLGAVASRSATWTRRFDPDREVWIYDLARPVVEGALNALGLRDGVFHLEFFYDEAQQRAVFSECAARRGGGFTHEDVEYKFGVDLGEAALALALGVEPPCSPKVRPEEVGTTVLIGRPGLLFAHPSPREVDRRPGVIFSRFGVPRGSVIAENLSASSERLGEVMLIAEDIERLMSRMDDVQCWFDERLIVAPQGSRQRDLWQWQHATWPEESWTDTLYQAEV
jgi:hypothetical protein